MVNDVGRMIKVEVIYALPDQIWRRQLELPPSATVQQAVDASGVTQDFPALGATPLLVGIYGRSSALRQVLRHGDRVEVYRPLVFDPMESRRRRAQHRQRKRTLSGA